MFHCFCLSSLVFVCVQFRVFNGLIPSHCLFRNRKLENSIFLQIYLIYFHSGVRCWCGKYEIGVTYWKVFAFCKTDKDQWVMFSIICFWLNWFVDLPLHSIFWTWKAGLLFFRKLKIFWTERDFFGLGSKMQLWWKIINTKLWFIPTTVKVCLYYNYASLQ